MKIIAVKSLKAEAKEIIATHLASGFLTIEGARWIVDRVGNEDLSLLLALDPLPVGAIVIMWPSGPLSPLPNVVQFVAHSPSARHALLASMVDLMRRKGYNRGVAINATGKADAPWVRAFLPEGGKVIERKSLFEFEIPAELKPAEEGKAAE